MIYSESCKNLQTNDDSIFNMRNQGYKLHNKGHMRKRSVSGKIINLYGKCEDSPNLSSYKKTPDTYAKRFKEKKPFSKNLENEVFGAMEGQKKLKRKKKKRNSR